MTGAESAIVVAAVAGASVVQSSTGFGFALLAGPALVAVLTPGAAVSSLAVLALVVNVVMLAAGRRRPRVLRRETARLIAWALPGLPLGVVLLTSLPDDVIRVAVGVLVLVAVALRLATPHWGLPRPVAGLTFGALTTSTGLNGPPVVLRLTALPIAFAERRDTLAALFLVVDVLGIVTLLATGVFAPPAATVALASIAVVGVLAGRGLRVGAQADRWAVGLLLAAAGAASIVAGLT